MAHVVSKTQLNSVCDQINVYVLLIIKINNNFKGDWHALLFCLYHKTMTLSS